MITGGAGGLGTAFARHIVARGGSVVLADLLDDEGKQLADELGAQARYTHLDVTDPEQWSAAVQFTLDRVRHAQRSGEQRRRVDRSAARARTARALPEVVEVNLIGVFNGLQAVIGPMRSAGGGSIVNISSAAGMFGLAFTAGYGASKWGVRGLSKIAAVELGPDRIRVNSVHPGMTYTPMTVDVGIQVGRRQLSQHPDGTDRGARGYRRRRGLSAVR